MTGATLFRQVVAHRWAAGLGDEAKEAFRTGLQGLRGIPELAGLRAGDDAGHFAGNFDYVAVLDFADFAAARRYVNHPLHRSFIEHHARTCLAERVVVQHDWGSGSVASFHHVKIPVTDVQRSRDWYSRLFGFVQEIEFIADGVLAGVGLRHPDSALRLALRGDPQRSRAMADFDLAALAVSTLADLRAMAARAASLGIGHGPIIKGHLGWACDIPDPDGILVRLYTHERHT
jgi:catechol 2,3-dioxygenase-like lactoylglutathione lyase family enzyme